MTLKDFYISTGSDYEGTLSRLMNERIMDKFVRKFPGDPSFDLLVTSVEASDWETAFRAAHTIKGVCANLGFTRLYEADFALTEALRGGTALTDISLYEAVKTEYKNVIAAINGLD